MENPFEANARRWHGEEKKSEELETNIRMHKMWSKPMEIGIGVQNHDKGIQTTCKLDACDMHQKHERQLEI